MEVVSQENVINIAIDADSLIFKACYRHQVPGGVDIELAYLEFCYEIGKIRSAVFRIVDVAKDEKVIPLIVLSPKKTFRNDLSMDYKANRPAKLMHGIKQLKYIVMDRLKQWALVVPNVEADDVVIYYAKHHNYLVSAIDKDVTSVCPTSCYNYNYRRWEYGVPAYAVETWYAKQALMGDSTDGISGADNIGKVGAQKWVDKYEGTLFSWHDFVEKFGHEIIAEQTMNLIRMDGLQMINNQLVWKPWNIYESQYWEF